MPDSTMKKTDFLVAALYLFVTLSDLETLQRALKQDELAELRHRIDLTARPIGTHDVIIP